MGGFIIKNDVSQKEEFTRIALDSSEKILQHLQLLTTDSPEFTLYDRITKRELLTSRLLECNASTNTLTFAQKKHGVPLDETLALNIRYSYKGLHLTFETDILEFLEMGNRVLVKMRVPFVLNWLVTRKHPRIRPSAVQPLKVTFTLPKPYCFTITEKAADISSEGMAIATITGKYFIKGSPLAPLEFTLPGGKHLKLPAEVRMITENSIGVRFADITEQQMNLINRYQDFRQSEIIGGKEEGPDAEKIVMEKRQCGTALAKILLVEDQMMSQMIIGDTLKRTGYLMVFANNGAEGIAKAIMELPDIILMDMNMPVMKGDEACKIIKQAPVINTIPVLILTTSQEKEDVINSVKAGAEDYIIKSSDPLIMLKKIKKTLADHSSQ